MRRIARILVFVLGALSALEGVAAAAARRMFVSSAHGDAKLGDWPLAGSATGVDAGDAICQALANASLPNPGTFVAWLSDNSDDAYCRVHGLSGKVSGNCGQGSLPETAGPWVRVNDSPFLELVSDGSPPPNGVVYLPARLDETGATVHASAWTGTWSDGTNADGYDCGEWTVNSGVDPDAVGGRTDRVGNDWSIGDFGYCYSDLHLFCFETGAGDPLPTFSNWGRLAFLTSKSGSGNLSTWPEAGGQSGLQAGDAICRNLAAAAALPEADSFKAWLSTGATDARDRFVNDGPWMRVDRARIGADLADLTDGYLHTGINLSETGVFERYGASVWTGTSSSGVVSSNRCSGWTSDLSTSSGGYGQALAADGDWTAEANLACDENGHLYCLQDLPLVFGDGFESGDATVWTSTVP